MPVVRVFTAIPEKEYKKLKRKVKAKNTTQYKLLQAYIIFGLNKEPIIKKIKKDLFFES